MILRCMSCCWLLHALFTLCNVWIKTWLSSLCSYVLTLSPVTRTIFDSRNILQNASKKATSGHSKCQKATYCNLDISPWTGGCSAWLGSCLEQHQTWLYEGGVPSCPNYPSDNERCHADASMVWYLWLIRNGCQQTRGYGRGVGIFLLPKSADKR